MKSTDRYATIVQLEDFAKLREGLGSIVCTSGGYDPVHPGHLTCIIESQDLADVLVVVVNGDSFLRVKKGKAFQDLETRCRILACVRGVDYVVPYEAPGDMTVSGALEVIRPRYFTKGGDRISPDTIAEWETCRRLGIEVVPLVGLPKNWSSSDFLRDWGEFWAASRGESSR